MDGRMDGWIHCLLRAPTRQLIRPHVVTTGVRALIRPHVVTTGVRALIRPHVVTTGARAGVAYITDVVAYITDVETKCQHDR